DADPDRGAHRHFGHSDDLAVLHQPLDDEDRDSADDQGDGDDHRVAEQSLDMLDQDVAHEPPGHRIPLEQAFEHRPESPPVEDDDGEDRAQLDDDVERLPLGGVEAQKLGGEDQVAGRGDGQELGDALDDAEDQGEEQERHSSGVAGQEVAVKLIRRPANLPPRWNRPSHSYPTAPSGVGSTPNASSPGSSPDGRLSRWSIIHWSRVSGAPGSQPKRDS